MTGLQLVEQIIEQYKKEKPLSRDIQICDCKKCQFERWGDLIEEHPCVSSKNSK